MSFTSMNEDFAWLKSTWCMKLILSSILFMWSDVQDNILYNNLHI